MGPHTKSWRCHQGKRNRCGEQQTGELRGGERLTQKKMKNATRMNKLKQKDKLPGSVFFSRIDGCSFFAFCPFKSTPSGEEQIFQSVDESLSGSRKFIKRQK